MPLLKNPFLELHREFRQKGADVLISSGQACVFYGIAAFSKDGDWIIKENKRSCAAVLGVLAKKNACYRLGAPLDPQWLKQGLTSHFEYKDENNFRIRVDICSRPPRISDIALLWKKALRNSTIDLIDIESLIMLKQTRRTRDYSIIGSLAEVAGFNEKIPEIALQFLHDFDLLSKAIKKWPEEASKISRKAVKLIINHASREEVVVALALEQNDKMEADKKRIEKLKVSTKMYQRTFMSLKKDWRKQKASLLEQHRDLMDAYKTIEANSND